jgi:hypothetical protein
MSTAFSVDQGTATSARAAAVIGRSIEIPPHLSLSPDLRLAVLPLRRPGTAAIEREPENANALSGKRRKRKDLADARRGRLARPRGLADLRAHGVDCGERWFPDRTLRLGARALMSLFHLSAWLKLASGRPWAEQLTFTKGD